MISQNTIQRVFDTAQIEDVVEDYVVLKKRGANMIGLCPFHNEKTPSFTVSPSKNIYKCFGCGKAGNSIGFLIEHDSLSYPEAIKTLAKRYGIEIEESYQSDEEREQQSHADSLYIINDFALEFFKNNLSNHDEGKTIALPYFRERGFTQDTIEKFELGYAIKGPTALKAAALDKDYNLDLMKEVGLISDREFDFFRERVMFPIHNLSGKVIAFGGRTLKKDKKIPKYINSPESAIYVKNKVLYGIYQSKTDIRKKDECLLVEGYTDVISLHQSGIQNVVASSGTSLTEGQIRLIKRNTENITVLYDGDLAGIKAALRGIDLILEQDMNVKVVLLPEDQDPDSYLKLVGKSEFELYIEEKAEDFIFFKTHLLKEDAASDPIQMTKVIEDIVSSISRIPNNLKRSLYIRECSNRLGIDEGILTTDVNKAIYNFTRQKRRQEEAEKRRAQLTSDQSFPSEEQPAYDPSYGEIAPNRDASVHRQKSYQISDEPQEKDIIRILICGGEAVFDEEANLSVGQYVLSNMKDVVELFENSLYIKVLNIYIQRIVDQKHTDLQTFINHTDPKISKLAIDLST
ncbi:MAG: DNA primase, partial [Bacteroidia bacterium]|nr:DNA primase [Bacteroidia bacterium]